MWEASLFVRKSTCSESWALKDEELSEERLEL
jgi:hypothetical protein